MANGVLDALTKLVLERPVLGVDPLDPKFEPDPRLQDDLEKAIKEQPAGPQLGGSDILTDHAFAVVDLTADPAKLAPDGLPYGPMRPAYAGWNDTEQRPIASLAKLLPLYGAYCMRDNLGSLAHALSIDNSTTLAESGRADYQQLGMSPPPGTRPRIERMFTVDNSANVEFALDDTSDPDLDEIHKDAGPQGFIARFKRTVPCRPDLPAADCAPAGNCGGRRSVLGTDTALNDELAAIKFREQLRLMAGWSDNVAAAVVIRALGFPYLWKLANVNQSRLYRHSWQPKMQEDAKKTGPGGLFLSKDYNCARWQPPEPVPPEAPPPKDKSLAASGNAQSIAVLLTMLGQDRLFTNPASHFGMREMLRRPPDFTYGVRGERGPIGIGMTKAYGEPALLWSPKQLPWDPEFDQGLFTPDTPLAVSKIGFEDNVVTNALLVRSKRPQKSGTDITVTAVLVGLCKGTDDQHLLEQFGTRMAQKLDARHGVT